MIAPRRTAAFTLFEILISIAIFLLLAGGIFASVQAAFQASNQVAVSQLDAERSAALQQLMRRFFASLPAEAKVELRLRKLSGRGDVVELLAAPVPAFLRFGADAKDGIALSGLPDGRGGFRFSLGYFEADAPPEKRDRQLDEGPWLSLLGGVKEIRWRMAPARNPVFTDVWDAENGRPGVAELTLVMANGAEGTYAYWIPPLQRRTSGPGLDSSAPRPPGGGPTPAPGGADQEEGDGEESDGGSEQPVTP